jgi:hypothetical protein
LAVPENGVEEELELLVSRVAIPGPNEGALEPPELEREAVTDIVDEDGNKGALPLSFCRLVLDPVGLNRIVRPDDDDDVSRVEFRLDHPREALSRWNLPIPPDREATLLKPFDQWSDTGCVC